MSSSAFQPFRSESAREEYHNLYKDRAKAWPVPSETRLIETDSGQTFCRVSGQATDPPLVLLPGARGTSLTWIPNIKILSAEYRTYAIDSIYDYGLSARRKSIKTREDLLTWLDEVLAAIAPTGRVHLMGLSYGGWLACLYALKFPRRVHKLVLLTPAATVLPVSFTMLCRAILTLIPAGNFRKNFYYWLLQDSVKGGNNGQAYIDEAIADWITADHCFSPLPLIPATVLKDEELRGLTAPTLYLVGENEKVFPPQKAIHRLNRVAPLIQTRLIPGAGHDLWYVQSELVTKEILDFLNA